MRHILSVLVENNPGVLSRVAGLFARRGYNIESLAVGTTEDPDRSRMTIIVDGDSAVIEQVCKQLNKMIDTLKVTRLPEQTVCRELALIKVSCTTAQRTEILGIVDIFRANVLDVTPSQLTVEVTGDEAKVDALCELLRPYGLLELARTGVVALERGALTRAPGNLKSPRH